MEQVLGSHGAFTLGLFALCGGIIGLKAGLWAVVLLSVVCMVGVSALWLWENWQWLRMTQRITPGALLSLRPILSTGKGTHKNGAANL